MSLEYRVGDVFDELAKIPDGTIDLIVTSPPRTMTVTLTPAEHAEVLRQIAWACWRLK